MKVFFLVTGIGYGDATRVQAVIDAMLKKEPLTKFLIAGYDCSYNYFKDRFRTIKITGYRMPGKEMKFTLSSFAWNNYTLPLVWLFTAFRLKRDVRAFNPDIVVTDFEPAGISIAKSIHRNCVALYGFDPELYDEYVKQHKPNRLMAMEAVFLKKVYDLSDYSIIVSLLKRKKSLIYNYIDPIVRTNPADLPSEAKIMKELNLGRRPIIVMLGGSNFGVSLARSISKVANEFNELFLVFGSGTAIEKQNNLIHIPFTKEFLKYLKVSKGLITLGGQKTLSEGIIFKKPMLVYPIHDHVEQQLNAYCLRDYIITGRNLLPEAVKKSVSEFLANLPELRHRLAMLKTDGNGAEQAADILFRLAKKKK